MSVALALFLRPPVAGQVKTRLQASLGAEGACQLYRAFLRDTVDRLGAAPGYAPTLWVAGDPDQPDLTALLVDADAARLPRRRQPEGDLGTRMAEALQQGTESHPAAVALGTDSPTLPSALLLACRQALAFADLVLGPAADGGYYLLGVRRSAAALLPALLSGVRWSCRHTMADTVGAAVAAGLRIEVLPPWVDVDDAEGLRLLRLQLRYAPSLAPHTARLLGEYPCF